MRNSSLTWRSFRLPFSILDEFWVANLVTGVRGQNVDGEEDDDATPAHLVADVLAHADDRVGLDCPIDDEVIELRREHRGGLSMPAIRQVEPIAIWLQGVCTAHVAGRGRDFLHGLT